jgi:TDG/mug DNA glycosylase family protein
VLNDLCAPNLRVIFCGTAAGHRSAVLKQYYAGRGNRFWQILAETKLTPRLLAPTESSALLRHGIGLTDVAKGQRGNDVDIRFSAGDRSPLYEKILEYQPAYLCFNGKRAAQEFLGTKAVKYGLQRERIGESRLFVAPSTSGAARGSWDAAIWRDLARRIRRGTAA